MFIGGWCKKKKACIKVLDFLILRKCKVNRKNLNKEVPVRKEGIFNSLNKTFHYTIIYESYINNKKILLEGL